MKTMNLSLKFIRPALATALAVVITCGLSIRSAQAGYIVSLQQVGLDVVATGSGPIDFTGLTSEGSSGLSVGMTPSSPAIGTGPTTDPAVDVYSSPVAFAGPTNFGPGGGHNPDSGSGDIVGIFPTLFPFGEAILLVPAGYVSGNLSDSMTFNNQTFSTLGVIPGTYVWTWGTGVNQNFTLQIGAVPDAGSTLGLLSLAVIALLGINRFRACRLA
jgi:hypothetical protein